MHMYIDTWNNCHASICSITFSDHKNERIGSGTGFKVGSHLVTNNHVYVAPGAVDVELQFMNEDGNTAAASKKISYQEFQSRLKIGLPENSWDYAILSIPDNEFSAIPSLTLSQSSIVRIGHPVVALGFQFDQSNLSIKQGILSSRFIKADVKYIQIDASVNQGDSGGPLINPDNNQVIGIITRKHTETVNMQLRPTKVIVFGSPAVGTNLMIANQSIANELPLKMTVWEDEKGVYGYLFHGFQKWQVNMA